MVSNPPQRERAFGLVAAISILAALAALGMAPSPAAPSALSYLILVVSLGASIGLLAWCPGRIVFGLLNVSGPTGPAFRTLLSVALSLALAPLLLDALWRRTHNGWILLGIWWAAMTALALWARSRAIHKHEIAGSSPLFEHRSTRVFAFLLGSWIAACLVLTYWPDRSGGCPVPANPHDFVKHHAVLDSLQRNGLPLGNVFCADAADEPYYYYHYFYLPLATARIWTGDRAGAAAVFGIFTALVALSCVGLIYVLAKRLAGGEAPATLAAAVASIIGGLDVIPLALQHKPVVTLDAWADVPFRIQNFYTHFAWCPQHVLGLVILLTGVLLLGLLTRRTTGWLLLGPLLIAALIGTTAYLAVAALIGLAAAALLNLCRRDDTIAARSRKIAAYLGIAVVAALLAAPQLSGYLEMSRRFGQGFTTDWPRNSFALLGNVVQPGILANWIDLPGWLLLEYGVRGVACLLVGMAVYRRCWRDPGLRLLLIISVVGLSLFATVRSGVHRFDYGFKIGLLASMAMSAVLCGALLHPQPGRARWSNPLGWQLRADFRRRPRRGMAILLTCTLLLGLPVGAYEAPVSAVRRFVRPGKTFIAEKEAYRFLHDELPPDAVVQTHTAPPRATLIQLAGRQWGVLDPADSDVGVFRPPDPRVVEDALNDVRFAGQTDSSQEAHRRLRAHRITHLLVGLAERQNWQHLDKFDDPRYFSPVYRDEAVTVYELNRSNTQNREPSRPY